MVKKCTNERKSNIVSLNTDGLCPNTEGKYDNPLVAVFLDR